MKRLVTVALAAALIFAALPARAEGSWGQINQPIDRAENWTSFVESSPFVLGGSAPLPSDPSIRVVDWGGYPSIDGSTVCVPMAMELARQHLGMKEEDLAGFVAFSTTHFAYERLIGGRPNPTITISSQNAMMDPEHPVDLFLGTEPSDDELQLASDAGVALIKVPVCYDAFVFLVNQSNPVENLSLAQIRDVYTGKTVEWGDVGGEEGRIIIPYQRPKNSGSQTAMENLVMQGVALSGAMDNYISDGMGDLVSAIGDYENGADSIGYSYLYYVDVLYQSGEIKVLSVDGVPPTPENLRSGRYPFATCYYAVYRQGDEIAAAFAEWLQSDAGQRCVEQAGYIPYSE